MKMFVGYMSYFDLKHFDVPMKTAVIIFVLHCEGVDVQLVVAKLHIL